MSRKQVSSMNRREFFKTSLAGATALSALRPLRLAAQASSQKSAVAVVVTRDRVAGVQNVLKLLSFPSPKGKNVLIKPNFNTQDPTPGSTHNDTLRQVILEMNARGASSITIGERSGPPVTKKVMEDKGIPALAQELGVQIIDYEDLGPDGWAHFKPEGTHWQNGFDIAKAAAEAEYLVSTCCLKTHGSGGVFSMSLKLAVGMTPKALMRELHGNRATHMRRMIAELNQGYKPKVIIMDGIDIFVDGGPSRGKLVTAGVFVGGTDRVAVDAVGLAILKHFGSNEAIMSKKIFEQDQIQRAAELGIGVKGPDRIELVTADAPGRSFAEKIRAILAQG
jgi:uncharacterized protein (DUF362 family)